MREIFDVFLAGPWEQYCSVPWKTKIKEAFPELKFFDPEIRPAQKDGSWFVDNYLGIRDSVVMVVFVPDFPFSMAAQEAGMFYEMHAHKFTKPMNRLIYIWLPEVGPGRDWGKEGCVRMGQLVDSVDGAIQQLANLTRGWH